MPKDLNEQEKPVVQNPLVDVSADLNPKLSRLENETAIVNFGEECLALEAIDWKDFKVVQRLKYPM